MRECEQAVALQSGEIDQYVHNKIDLAHRIMQSITEDARLAIRSQQCPLRLANGLQLAVLPARLWVTNDQALQMIIHSYYDDWRLTFIGDALTCDENYHEKMCQQGAQNFLAWLGYWFTRQMGLSTVENIMPPSSV